MISKLRIAYGAVPLVRRRTVFSVRSRPPPTHYEQLATHILEIQQLHGCGKTAVVKVGPERADPLKLPETVPRPPIHEFLLGRC